MRIKKWIIFGIFGLTAIGTGAFLLTVLFEGLSKYGIKGYFFLVIFVISSITYFRGQRGIDEKAKIAEQVAEEVSREYQGKIGDMSAESAKAELEKHLKNKIENENYRVSFKNLLNTLKRRSNNPKNRIANKEELEDEKLVEKAMKVLSQGYPTASLSLFKRELLIGHKAATRLMISLEERGVIEPDDSRLSKKVLINNPSPIFCVACKSTKINKSEVICASCQEWVKEVQKSLKSAGYTTWPKLRVELRIGYAGIIRTLDYMVKAKILLPPDESGKYFLADNTKL
ncbi:MAG: hypothetical protein UU56_C0001G0048 [Candidatus Curtissbacteria bacterium GW2011_GWA2_41_24]|uniref:FtsK gamma domain-containing protein n=1 Tax=Candidatus Curtissbacteria bacterium GW2011_GWA2_41_24 TaxID=1618411 RepID=A0A0G0Y6K4_9BACT|nr:MAG: hypothetical protein UU56_C0001G0048 [Candidatus Curtissbacteria bacterium GW2011_GWA2_41_24]